MQIGLGIQNWHDIRQEICPSYLTDDHSPAAVPRGFPTWAVLLLPFTEQGGLYFGFDLTVPLDATPRTPSDQYDRQVLESFMANYCCPSRDRVVNPVVLGDYACVSLAEAVPGRVLRAEPRTWDAAMLASRAFNASSDSEHASVARIRAGYSGRREYRSMTTFKSVTDGLSNTAFVGEKAVRDGHFGGRQIDSRPRRCSPASRTARLYYGAAAIRPTSSRPAPSPSGRGAWRRSLGERLCRSIRRTKPRTTASAVGIPA